MTHAIGRVPRNTELAKSNPGVRSRLPISMLSVLPALAIILSLGFADTVSAEGDAERGRDKANTCMGCHGAVGIRNAYPSFTVPKLAGQQVEYIVAALMAYKDKTRPHPTMQANADNLSPEDMADIGAYFSTLGK